MSFLYLSIKYSLTPLYRHSLNLTSKLQKENLILEYQHVTKYATSSWQKLFHLFAENINQEFLKPHSSITVLILLNILCINNFK